MEPRYNHKTSSLELDINGGKRTSFTKRTLLKLELSAHFCYTYYWNQM